MDELSTGKLLQRYRKQISISKCSRRWLATLKRYEIYEWEVNGYCEINKLTSTVAEQC